MRSTWKLPFIASTDLGLLRRQRNYPARILTILNRSSTILNLFVGRRVLVHQGRRWVRFLVRDYMVGHKFGEYAPTRRVNADMHAKKKAKKGGASTSKKKG
jgi:small subunit ribosomal protein S19